MKTKVPQIIFHGSAQGWFKCEAFRPRDGRRRLLADWFPNLITNAGLNHAGTAGGYLGECRVGSGSTTPNVLDTALDAQIASTTNLHDSDNSAEASAPFFGAVTNVYRFAEGVAAGILAEVGLAPNAGNLFSRALILDGLGDPTTITVDVDEVLDVTYQLRLYPPLVDVTGTVNISGTDYDYTARAMLVTSASNWAPASSGEQGGVFSNGVNAFDGAIGTIETSPAGSSSPSSSATNEAYSADSHEINFEAVWGLDNGNLGGGIQSVACIFGTGAARFGAMQVEFDPPIPKDDTKVLTLGFKHAWARKTLP